MTEDISDGSKSFHPTWDGNEDKLSLFHTKIRSAMKLKKVDKASISAALEKGGESDLPDREDETLATDADVAKLQQAAKDRNDMCMAMWTRAFSNNCAMQCAYDAQTDECPDGLAWKIEERTMKELKPTDLMSLAELRAELNKLKMKKDDNPKKLFLTFSQLVRLLVRLFD